MQIKIFFKTPQKVAHFRQADMFEILRRVRFNMPDCKSDFLQNLNVNISGPIFAIDGERLTMSMAKSLWLAGKIERFCLVVFYRKREKVWRFRKVLTDAFFLNKRLVQKQVKETIYSLNVNFRVANKCGRMQQGEWANGAEFVVKKLCENSVMKYTEFCNLQKTFFNGDFYFFEKVNNANKKINILIKKYFVFNKFNYFLLNLNKNIFFYDVGGRRKIFVRSDANVQVSLEKVRANKFVAMLRVMTDKEKFFVYIGTENIDVDAVDLEKKILWLADGAMWPKIKTLRAEVGKAFNKLLPQKILRAKILGQEEKVKKLEKEYFKIKRKLYRVDGHGIVFGRDFQKLYFWQNGIQKRVVRQSVADSVQVGGTRFLGAQGVSHEVLQNFDDFVIG